MTAARTTDPHMTDRVIALSEPHPGSFAGRLDVVPARLVSPVLVGRREELAALATAYERACGGEPATVVVGGEAGGDKTRLVEEAAARATGEGARVLTGRCVELGGE